MELNQFRFVVSLIVNLSGWEFWVEGAPQAPAFVHLMATFFHICGAGLTPAGGEGALSGDCIIVPVQERTRRRQLAADTGGFSR